ncbi:hypothetical protein LCGC14_1750790 [marine sediment metagenome]|uniref:Uncharacterized protein n=1 Tax=marine sediment metagenome TaxID=412755 RepID=A0A0F9H409_9ZZZZ
METIINWELGQGVFRRDIRRMIRKAHSKGKTLPLPLSVKDSQASLDLMQSIISQVNCDGCDAPCCRSNPGGKPLQMVSKEYDHLVKILGQAEMDRVGAIRGEPYSGVPLPCKWLMMR